MVTFLYGGDRNESGNIIQEKPVMHPEIPGSKKCVGAVSTRMTPLKMGKELRVYICNLCFGIAGLAFPYAYIIQMLKRKNELRNFEIGPHNISVSSSSRRAGQGLRREISGSAP